jgi:hypothetical protein
MSYLTRIRESFLAPSRSVHAIFNIVATLVSLKVSEAILVRNQRNYVYPADGDSIGIPLVGMMFYSILSLGFLLFGMLLVRQRSGIRWLGYALLVLIAVGYLIQILDWADPLHYGIGLAQASLGALVFVYLCLEMRRHRLKTRSTPNE